jgi:hypothetical protein
VGNVWGKGHTYLIPPILLFLPLEAVSLPLPDDRGWPANLNWAVSAGMVGSQIQLSALPSLPVEVVHERVRHAMGISQEQNVPSAEMDGSNQPPTA